MTPPTHDELQALNAERLRQWAEALTHTGSSAIVVLGVTVGDKPGRVTVLSPDGVPGCDVLRLLSHAATTVAMQGAMN